MDPLVIANTKSTPAVHFDPVNHKLSIKGESYPENSFEFFHPVLEWVESYLKMLPTGVRALVSLEITYFNSSSSKVLLDFLDMLDDAAAAGKQITVEWRYQEGNDMASEYGEEFKEDLKTVEFVMVPIPD